MRTLKKLGLLSAIALSNSFASFHSSIEHSKGGACWNRLLFLSLILVGVGIVVGKLVKQRITARCRVYFCPNLARGEADGSRLNGVITGLGLSRMCCPKGGGGGSIKRTERLHNNVCMYCSTVFYSYHASHFTF